MVKIERYHEKDFNDDLLSRIIKITRNDLTEHLFHPINRLIEVVIVIDDIDVGCAVVYDEGDKLIDLVNVVKNRRREGIATLMIGDILSRYKNTIDVISLKSATPFWKSMGFTIWKVDDDVDLMRLDNSL